MMNLYLFLRRLSGDRKGISAVEYAILVGVVGVALVAFFSGEGTDPITNFISSMFTDLENEASGGAGG